jgi:hypothetical protein
VFTVGERDRVRSRVLELAAADPRVVAGAEIGALAQGGGDRWSDIDLTFGVDDSLPVAEVLADWTRAVRQEFDAVHLFDLGRDIAIYRVFLLPGCLQVDLSFAPASQFGARGPQFALLFGTAVELEQSPPPSPRHLFGLAVHHALRARICVERRLYWRAEYWVAELRRHGLELACLRRGLDPDYAKGFDHLPAEVRGPFGAALARSLAPDELLRALEAAVAALLAESADAGDLPAQADAHLREITGSG